MTNWEQFEENSCKFLNRNYANETIEFRRVGGSNANLSDIEVIKNQQTMFFIEVKMSGAQCGQFVLLNNNQKFTYSARNKSPENKYSKIITDHINDNYNFFKNVSTVPLPIKINSNILTNWVINHYYNKNVEFIITGYDQYHYIILPLKKLNNYFDIIANFRVKGSGSRSLPVKWENEAQTIINKKFNSGKIYYQGKKAYIIIKGELPSNITLFGKNYIYYLVNENNNIYQIRVLSNTANANVIFSCKLKQDQHKKDLLIFEHAIK